MQAPEPSEPFDPTVLLLGRDLRRQGIEPTRHRTEGQPTYRQVCRGVWMRSHDWRALTPTRRHAALVHGIALFGEDDGLVFTREAAAALWDLPRIDPWPSCVHGTCSGPRVRSSGRLVRHVDEFDLAYRHQGLLVTSPARTVVDLARSGSVANAVAAADHAVRVGLCDEAELWSEAHDVPPRSRGRHRALLVADLVDGRSMSAGESLSRVQLFLLNLPKPDLQVKCEDERGLIGYADFGWDGVVGEFDGRLKYRVPDGASAQEAAQVLWAEKRREDRIRATGLRMARWVYADAVHPERMARRLAEQGVLPTRRNTWFDVGTSAG